MPVFRISVQPRQPDGTPRPDPDLAQRLREAGLAGVAAVVRQTVYLVEGELTREQLSRAAATLLCDPVSESFVLHAQGENPAIADAPLVAEIHLRPGVMDPVAESTLAELRAEGAPATTVRTAQRLAVQGDFDAQTALAVLERTLANECIEVVVRGTAGVVASPKPPVRAGELRQVGLRALDDAALERLSREAHLFLSIDEMQAIREHFRALGRDPTDLEVETLAQTWSEHCVHKTLKSAILYRGDSMPAASDTGEVELRFDNLLKDTIARATRELIEEGRGPTCLSVFEDNAGIIAFDERYGVAFKVETHNHPSAIEPYGGAATGVGGCIRDIMGCGLGAWPVANTDVFCVAPPDWPQDALPKGVLHPRRVLRGVVRGVADYGNRMGIPTVNGAVLFDPRYLGNPLVYCGCVGLIPRDRIHKQPRAGDHVVLIGGRTGRDGIHGATFSSAELTDAHADEFSHAVQIGNAITEKRCLDGLMRARDAAGGCLYSAVTDCGAGGLSSAVGEMARGIGAEIELEHVPLKYAGLRYDEIWISEAQERMVVAVPPERLDRFLALLHEEEVEATPIGRFGTDGARLIVRHRGRVVGDLDTRFLHEGLPRRVRSAEWRSRAPTTEPPGRSGVPETDDGLLAALLRWLAAPNIASKSWIIRKYDHEVQGGSVVKPLGGPGIGPNDAAVVRPRLEGPGGVALGVGLAPQWSAIDPYWMAVAAIDEAIRNVVCVGGDPRRTALLDNFCWGRVDEPQALGALVRACQACYDAAKLHGTPFISGKDSLNNEFAVDAADVEGLAAQLEKRAAANARDPTASPLTRSGLRAAIERLRQQQRLAIPPTLLISSLALVGDVRRCVTADLKQGGNALFVVGGLTLDAAGFAASAAVHGAVADAIAHGLVSACHDAGEGGWLTALAEMAIGGARGAAIGVGAPANEANGAALKSASSSLPPPFEERLALYVVETPRAEELQVAMGSAGVACVRIGATRDDEVFLVEAATATVRELRSAWMSPVTGE